MIFSIGQNGLSFFNKSFDLIKTDRANGFNLFGSLFSKNPFGIPQSELQVLGTALDDVKNNVLTVDEAFNTMLADCTDATKATFEEFATAGKGSDALTASLRSAGSAAGFAKVGISALNMALSALTAMAIQFAIQAAIKGLDQLQNGAHNAAVAMKETAEKTAEQASNSAKEVGSLDDLIAKYEELAKSGVRDADTRAQVRDIQNEINGLVGSEAGQIDLVNGSYKEQLALLQQIRAEKAKEAIQNTYASYGSAKQASDNVTGDSTYGLLNKKGFNYSGKRNNDVVLALWQAGVAVGEADDTDAAVVGGWSDMAVRSNVDIYGNAISGAEANIKQLNDLISILEDAGLRDNEFYRGLIDQRQKYQDQLDNTNQQLEALLGQVIDTYRNFDAESKGIGGDTADAFREYYTDIINGVLGDEWLNDAIESGDLNQQHVADAVLSALGTSSGLSHGYNEYKLDRDRGSAIGGFAKKARGDISDSLVRYINSLEGEDLEIALRLALDPDSEAHTEEQLKSFIEREKAIPEVSKISFKEFYSGDTIKDTFDPILKRFQDAQSAITALENGTSTVNDLLVEHPEWSDFGGGDMQAYLKKHASDAKKAAEEAYAEARKGIAEEELSAYDAYVAAALQQYETPETLTIGIDIDVETKGMDSVISSIKSSVSQLGLNNEQVAQLQSRYKDIAGYFPDKLFEKTTNGIHLNTDALMELESVYEDQKKIDMQTNLEDLQREYAALTTEINRVDAAGGDTTGLYKQRSAIEAQINAITVAQSQFEALTSTYNKWKQAQSMGEEGDMFDDIQSNLKNIKELYDEGLIGTNKFKSAIELMTGKDAYGMSSAELIAAYDEAYPKMQKYFAEGTKGSKAFLKDLEKIGAATKTGDQWTLDFDAEEVAKQLGVSSDLVEIMVRKLKDYNFDVDLSGFGTGIEQYATDIDTAVGEITNSKEELTKAFESGEISTKEYVDAWKTLDQYEKDLQQMRSGAEPIEQPLSLDEAKEKIVELSGAIDELTNAGIEIPITLTGQYEELKRLVENAEHSWSEWDFGTEGTTSTEAKTGGNAGYWNRAITVNQMLETALQSQENAASIMQSFFGKGGNVDLLNRPIISSDKLVDMGYNTVRGEIATLFSHAASIGENGEIGVVLTPILPNGDVLEAGTMDTVLEDIFLGSDGKAHLPDGDWGFNLEDILVSQIDMTEIPEHLRGQFMDYFANSLHKAQEYFYAEQEPIEVAAEVEPSKVDTTGMFQDMPQVHDELLEVDAEVKPVVDDSFVDEVAEQVEKDGPIDVPTAPAQDEKRPAFEFVPVANFNYRSISDAGNGVISLVKAAEGVDGAEASIERLVDAYGQLNIAMDGVRAVDVTDSTSVDDAINSLKTAATEFTSAFADLGSKVDVGKIEIDADTQKALATISAMAVPDAEVVFNPNTDAVEAYLPPEKSGTVNYSASFTNVYAATVPKLSGVIEYQRQIVGPAGAAGMARAAGTAYRGGMGSVKGNGTALGGELGMETVVRDGKFFTIGDNGAEFFRYKDGDIIFNASQTEELLRTGKIRSGGGRGKVFGDDSAYAAGTAFALNTSSLLTDGGGSVSISGSGTLPSGKGKSSSKGKSKSGKSSKSKSKKDSGSDDLFDWIEVAIERVMRNRSRFNLTIYSCTDIARAYSNVCEK